MSTYETLKGLKVKFLSADTSGDRLQEGEIFYNSADFNLKSFISTAAFHSGSGMNSPRGTGGDCGTTTAGLVFGGNPGDAPYTTNATEEYNGIGFSSGGAIAHGSSDASGAGTQTAAVAFAFSDNPTASTQEYNGTSWSEVNDLPGSQAQGRGIGIQTAALLVGYASPGTATNEYDGTNWTTGGNHNTKRSGQKPGGWGTQTAAILASGYQTPPAIITSNTELYNGTSWTETGHSVTTAVKRTSVSTSGISTFGLICGGGDEAGTNEPFNGTQIYDGTSFSTSANLATARINAEGFGTATSAVVTGGPYGAGTEEFTVSLTATTAAAWASGGNLNTSGRSGAAGSGIQTASIIAGGGLGTVLNNTESYNGSSWTNLPTLGTARGYMAGATNAPYTATVVFGGGTGPGGPYVNNSEEYSGSSWSEGNNLNTGRGYLAGFGTQTAGAAAGGEAGGAQSLVEEYNGTSWSEVNNMPSAAIAFGGCGTQTTGLIIGDAPMKGATYDGTNWTTIPTMNVGGNYNKVFGTSASAMSCGRNPGQGTVVEEWNGTNWFSQASLATGRFNGGQTGTTTAGLVAGPPTATEEFTAESTAARAVKTIDFD